MDAKELKKKTTEYQKAKAGYRQEFLARDQAVHGEGATVKYDPSTGTLKQEK